MLTQADLYDLLLEAGTRDWERRQIRAAITAVDEGDRHAFGRLEAQLRPLAMRANLTPAVADAYARLTGEAVPYFDFVAHADARARYPHAIFAGGCFWCLVQPFETLPGVVSVESGYTGGSTPHPTYDSLHHAGSGHVEAVEIVYDPDVLDYSQLLDLYWQLSDPTDALGQGLDRGPAYRPVIFYADDAQLEAALASKAALATTLKKPVVTAIEPASTFWPAENFHQQFYRKQPRRYQAVHRARAQVIAHNRR